MFEKEPSHSSINIEYGSELEKKHLEKNEMWDKLKKEYYSESGSRIELADFVDMVLEHDQIMKDIKTLAAQTER